jgi:hypothetical protein
MFCKTATSKTGIKGKLLSIHKNIDVTNMVGAN